MFMFSLQDMYISPLHIFFPLYVKVTDMLLSFYCLFPCLISVLMFFILSSPLVGILSCFLIFLFSSVVFTLNLLFHYQYSRFPSCFFFYFFCCSYLFMLFDILIIISFVYIIYIIFCFYIMILIINKSKRETNFLSNIDNSGRCASISNYSKVMKCGASFPRSFHAT